LQKNIFRLFLVSPEERDYIEKINEELHNSIKLDEDLKDTHQKLEIQRSKRIKSNAVQESAESLAREVKKKSIMK